MSCWGSFSPEAYHRFSSGNPNPLNEMVVAPALAHRAAYDKMTFMMDEGEDEPYEMEDEYEDEGEDEDEYEGDTNASMAMGQLRAMAEDIMLILGTLSEGGEIEPWVSAKITMSQQNLSSVSDHLRFGDSD